MNGGVTRFGKGNVPPVLYHIADVKDWKNSAEVYTPSISRNMSHVMSVQLCDLDRLDLYSSTNFFTTYYHDKLNTENSSWISNAGSRFLKTISIMPIAFASALNGTSQTRKNNPQPRPVTTRLNGMYTHLYSSKGNLIQSTEQLLIIIDTSALNHEDDLEWDSQVACGSDTVILPRLTRPLSRIHDIHAEFPLVYDAKKGIVALPTQTEINKKFQVCRSIADAF